MYKKEGLKYASLNLKFKAGRFLKSPYEVKNKNILNLSMKNENGKMKFQIINAWSRLTSMSAMISVHSVIIIIFSIDKLWPSEILQSNNHQKPYFMIGKDFV